MRKNKTNFVRKHALQGVLAIFIAVCLITGVFCFQYYNRLQSTIRGESGGYLQEIARRIGSNIDQIIDDNYAVLNTLTSLMKNSGAVSFSDIQPIVETQKEYWKFREIILIDENGKAYNTDGKDVTLNNDTYFSNAVTNKQQGISTTQMIDNQECIMLTSPLSGISLDGKSIVALAAAYDPAAFDKTLSMTSFNGQAYSCIISKSGTMVLRSSSASAMKTGYNVLTTVGESELDAGSSIQMVQTGMTANREGQIGFELDGERYYMTYTPVNPEDWYLLTFVPAKVVNEKSDMLLNTTLVICGLITLVFAGLIAFILFIFFRNKQKLEQIAYVDEITGGNTIQKFYELAEAALSISDHPQYALVYTNLSKFKVLNEQFGRKTCDNILKSFYQNVETILKNKECIGRLSADNFCMLLEYREEESLITKFETLYQHALGVLEQEKPVWSLPMTEFGVYVIDNDSLPFPQMIDRAKLALRESARTINSKLRCAIYNDEVRRLLFREKQLEDMMEEALMNREFQVYLQPKYRVDNETIGGAEALARWLSPTEGMIFPDEFIPLFEKNGFVIQLDLFVFEEVCRYLRAWLDQKLQPMKISVNCSRAHLKNVDFLNPYRRIAEQYRIPSGLIEIELTESIVMEDSQRLTHIISEIHSLGFSCSMDDFGSGYSSLNLLQSIPVDTLKIDKIFFKKILPTTDRAESVVSSIVTMAQALSMETVAEGVEYPEQVQMLKKIGCDLIQGYVFAKPMPIADFEKLAFDQYKSEVSDGDDYA